MHWELRVVWGAEIMLGQQNSLETLAVIALIKAYGKPPCYHIIKTRENLFRRNLSQALFHIDTTLALIEELGRFSIWPNPDLMKAIVMHELGKQEEAEQYWEQSIDLACRIKYRF